MVRRGKFERYLIEEFVDDYRAGAMTQRTFTRRVAFITGTMAAASAAMLLVGCTRRGKSRAATARCPRPQPRRRGHLAGSNRAARPEGYRRLLWAGADLNKIAAIKAAVFGVYAELDQRITGVMPALRDALDASTVVHQLTVYPGVDHAFRNDTGERYDQTQAIAAWNNMLSWFGQHV